jgi:hypothetical protein
MGVDGPKFSETQIAPVEREFAIASLAGNFFSDPCADRDFAAGKFVAVSHLVGNASILGMFL